MPFAGLLARAGLILLEVFVIDATLTFFQGYREGHQDLHDEILHRRKQRQNGNKPRY